MNANFSPATQIVPTPPTPYQGTNIPEALYYAKQRGEIDHKTYAVGNAVWVSENLRHYLPLDYTAMTPQEMEYTKLRYSGAREYDEGGAKRLGSWVRVNVHRREQNDSNESLMSWCQAILTENGMLEASQLIKHRLDSFIKTRYPADLIRMAMAVKAMDSSSRP